MKEAFSLLVQLGNLLPGQHTISLTSDKKTLSLKVMKDDKWHGFELSHADFYREPRELIKELKTYLNIE